MLTYNKQISFNIKVKNAVRLSDIQTQLKCALLVSMLLSWVCLISPSVLRLFMYRYSLGRYLAKQIAFSASFHVLLFLRRSYLEFSRQRWKHGHQRAYALSFSSRSAPFFASQFSCLHQSSRLQSKQSDLFLFLFCIEQHEDLFTRSWLSTFTTRN